MNKKFIFAIISLLIIEFTFRNIFIQQRDIWIAIPRVLSSIMLAGWYYLSVKPFPSPIHKLFLTSLLLPITITLTFAIYPKYGDFMNIFIHTCVLAIWAYIFTQMGARIKLLDKKLNFLRLLPIYYILPIFFYTFSIHPSIPNNYVIFLLTHTLVYSTTGILAIFLPIREESRAWISWSIALMVFANMLYSYDIFMEEIAWANIISRIIIVASRCMIVYGMIKYFTLEKEQPVRNLTINV